MDTKKNMSREQLLAYMRDNCTEAEAQQVRMWLRERLKDLPIQVMSGMEGLLAAATAVQRPAGRYRDRVRSRGQGARAA